MTVPRMLVLDLDGTTLTADRTLTARDVAAARALAEGGVVVTIATGRLFTGTRWVAEALGVWGSVAVMNGSEVVDVQSGVARHGRYLDGAARRTIRTVLEPMGMGTFLFGSRRIHYGARDAQHAPYLGIWTEHLSAWPDVFDAPDWHDGDDVVAVGVVGREDRILEVREELRSALTPEVETVMFGTFGGEAFLKLRRAEEDKGTALVRLAAERGLEAADCVAVGDWLNDVPMLQVAGRSFVMAHARDEVRVHAQEVLDASREGGAVAEVARRVWDLDV